MPLYAYSVLALVADESLRLTEKCAQMANILNDLKDRACADERSTISGLLDAV